MRNYPPERVWKTVAAQAALTLFLGLVLLTIGKAFALSGIFGGVAATVGNLLFARALFGRYSAGEPGLMVGRIYGAEIVKLLVMVLIFAAVIKWYESLEILAMLGVWMIVHLTPGIMIVVKGNNKESKR